MTVLSGVLMATAYLQTRALWLPWGFHFGWNAAMAVLFGLPVSGLDFSAVVSSNSVGPTWLTGGGYGPEGSLTAVVVLVVSLVVLVKMTREYAWKYAQPVIVPGGIPVDLDAAQARVHEAAQGHLGGDRGAEAGADCVGHFHVADWRYRCRSGRHPMGRAGQPKRWKARRWKANCRSKLSLLLKIRQSGKTT